MTEVELIDALRDCYEPLLRRNIVELNFLRSITFELDEQAPGATVPGVPPRYCVHIVLAPASGDEIVRAQLRAQVENRLAGLPSISRVFVDLLPPTFSILNKGRG